MKFKRRGAPQSRPGVFVWLPLSGVQDMGILDGKTGKRESKPGFVRTKAANVKTKLQKGDNCPSAAISGHPFSY
ncbi:MAG: hypothetical protein SPE95_07555 [Oscillospiraceae bacterium]|nr:hypothetical protein [Bacteroidales bacterium]MDD6998893.1 hypothetical protein [Oscillospiraceae bacterium]MDY5096098.1 hypothetical protein [Oscillospiraceae bacterium]